MDARRWASLAKSAFVILKRIYFSINHPKILSERPVMIASQGFYALLLGVNSSPVTILGRDKTLRYLKLQVYLFSLLKL